MLSASEEAARNVWLNPAFLSYDFLLCYVLKHALLTVIAKMLLFPLT